MMIWLWQGQGQSWRTMVPCALTSRRAASSGAMDTRCVLATDGTVKRITEDHKPKLPRENKRIEDAGGTVAHGRVQGLLAVSRCFGDQASALVAGARVARVARVCFSGARARARGSSPILSLSPRKKSALPHEQPVPAGLS